MKSFLIPLENIVNVGWSDEKFVNNIQTLDLLMVEGKATVVMDSYKIIKHICNVVIVMLSSFMSWLVLSYL